MIFSAIFHFRFCFSWFLHYCITDLLHDARIVTASLTLSRASFWMKQILWKNFMIFIETKIAYFEDLGYHINIITNNFVINILVFNFSRGKREWLIYDVNYIIHIVLIFVWHYKCVIEMYYRKLSNELDYILVKLNIFS